MTLPSVPDDPEYNPSSLDSPLSNLMRELAGRIVQDALESDDRMFRIEAFKVVVPFALGLARLRKPDDDPDAFAGVSMDEMRARIAEAGNGGGEEPRLLAGARRRAAGEIRERDRNGKFS